MRTTIFLNALMRTTIFLTALISACGATTTPPSPAPDIDALAATILDEELGASLDSSDVDGALAVIVDARTGRIVAMQSVADDVRDPPLPGLERRSRGSVGKAFTYAIAIDRGLLHTTDQLDGAPITVNGVSIADHAAHTTMNVEDAVAFSSNVAAVHAYERFGSRDLLIGLSALHLDQAIPAAAEQDNLVLARLAFGPALEATPLEIASAYGALVNGGTYHAPWRAGEVPSPSERVLSAATSRAMRELLEAAVARSDATGHLARLEGHRVGGKTGTVPQAEGGMLGCFVGFFPVDDPAYVVVVDVMARTSDYSGGTLAAPLFARIGERLLDAPP